MMLNLVLYEYKNTVKFFHRVIIFFMGAPLISQAVNSHLTSALKKKKSWVWPLVMRSMIPSKN